MPINRRERESVGDGGGPKPPYRIVDHIPTDHELFLQAFEKPTQIYRYLRSRNNLSPIFLHRNLTYMKERMSRKHNSRQSFRVNSLLHIVTNRIRLEEEKNAAPNNFMTLMFLGFYSKFMVEEQFVEVEIVVSKISHMKRKDSFKSKQDRLGSAIVKINPVDMIGKIPAVSVSTDLFKPAGSGLLNSSCILQLNITVLPNFTTAQEPIIKNEDKKVRIFETELVIFDKHNRCILNDGEYELTLHERVNTATPKIYSPKKHPTWEVIPEHCLDEFNKGDNPMEDFTKSPTLKFRLSWTKDKYAAMVDRPLPITIRKDDHFITNTKAIEQNCAINGTGGGGVSGNNSTTATTTTSLATLNTTTTTAATMAVPRNNNSINNNNNISSNLNNSAANNSMIVKLHDIASRIIYHFIYNNNSSQQTETCDNFNCPWCCLHCMTLYSLLKHLKLCHARFNFTYVPTPNGVRVDVSINELFDGSYIGSPHDLVGPAGSAFARSGPVRRAIVTRILVCRPRRPKHSLTEFLEIDENELNSQRPYITGHNRLYHHTLTCLPVHPKGLDIDSEGENDPAWLQHKTMQMIDEFTDVNEGEKELMKMWNLHIMRNGYVGDIQIPLACDMFLDMRGKELLQKNLYKNFVLHMCNFFDYGLISPEMLYTTIQKLQRILSAYNEGCEIMSQGREKQLDYWIKVGVHKQKELQLQQPAATTTANSLKRKLTQSMTRTDVKTKTKDYEDDDEDNYEDEDINECNVANGKKGCHERRTRCIDSNNDHDNNDDVDTKIEIKTKARGDVKNRLDFKDHKLMAAVVPVLKKISIKATAAGNTNSRSTEATSLKRRKSTILPAKGVSGKPERSTTSVLNKRKASHSRGESPPRRRSASAALQLNSGNFTATRRNSSAAVPSSLSGQTSAASSKKGKRFTIALPKIVKVDKS